MDETRPAFDEAMSAAEFDRWYWSKAELEEACARLEVPAGGSKAALRARVAFALDHPGEALPREQKPQPKSRFAWGREALTNETVITDNISFGPNVRGFFASEIGKAFVCHGDFMAWVREHEGATLGDAVGAWHMLEARKDDPSFRREIAEHNNFLRYLRAFQDAHPGRSLDEGRACWAEKKRRPAAGGTVVFEDDDLRFLDR